MWKQAKALILFSLLIGIAILVLSTTPTSDSDQRIFSAVTIFKGEKALNRDTHLTRQGGPKVAGEIYTYLQEAPFLNLKLEENIGPYKMKSLVSGETYSEMFNPDVSTKQDVQSGDLYKSSGQDGGDVPQIGGRKLLCAKSHKRTSKHKPLLSSSSCTHSHVPPSVFSPSVSPQPQGLSITVKKVTYVCIGSLVGVGTLIATVWMIIKYLMSQSTGQPQAAGSGAGGISITVNIGK